MEVHRAGGRYTFNLAALRYFRRHFRNRRLDVVIEDLNKVPLFTPLWVANRVVLLVHHLFGRTAFGEASLPLASATWLLERPVPRVFRSVSTIAVSRSTADDLVARGMRSDTISVIHNGVDLDLYRPDPAQRRYPEPTLLYLGRLKRYKRVDLVIRAVAGLVERGVECRLLIAGSGDREEALKSLAGELGLHERVEFLGFVDDARKIELFRRSWVHLLTSSKEGWGISNLEAAACGTATVASDSPGLRDSVQHGETGFLVPHGDVETLVDRIAALLGDATLRDRCGARARAFAEGFSWDESARQMEHFLEVHVARDAAHP
jgi:glycosyltransferase involved in cell wall biosynthesis